jgi:WhiB family redox-sensing transcriptional regulator
MKQAACRGMDPNLFMPVRGENTKTKQAKAICKDCVVLQQCRNYGLELAQQYDTHGIFGGLTRQERSARLREAGLTVRRSSDTIPRLDIKW